MVSHPLARLVMPAVRWKADTGFDHEMAGIRRALDLGVGGFIIFGGTPSTVRILVEEMSLHARRPLLIGSDLERGAGQQIEGLTEFPPPGALGSLQDDEVIRAAARTTALEARSVGINWVFAPVADLDIEPANPIVQSRSFGGEAQTVSRQVAEWVTHCQLAGALACVKHYPGHGRTTTDSHAGLPVVDAPAERLAQELSPFDAAIQGDVAAVMTAHVAFPALDPSGNPATYSEPILGQLRSRFEGLVVTDAMIMEGAKRGDEGEAAVEIVRAGVDILLYPQDPAATIAGLERGAANGRLSADRIGSSLARYEAALARAHRPSPVPSTDPSEAARIADRLLERGMARGARPSLRGPLEVTIIDDDVGGPYPPSPGVLVPDLLEAAGAGLGSGGSRVVLVFAEPRGWKSRAGLSDIAKQRLAAAAAAADLVIVFGHPRIAAAIPGGTATLVAWHRQRLMQSAVARWLTALT